MSEKISVSQLASQFAIPISIIIAGALIAGGLLLSGRTFFAENDGAPKVNLNAVREVTDRDHIMGDPNAQIVVIEYSDFECPFCKSFHQTMNRIMDEYGDSGTVAWVYRHFPLDSIHTKARIEAVASECAAEQGGNTAFWAFTNRFFEVTPSNDQTDIQNVIPAIADEIGLEKEAFLTCLESGKYDAYIQEDLNNAVATGARGTPWSIVLLPNGKKVQISGGQPYDSVKQLIEQSL